MDIAVSGNRKICGDFPLLRPPMSGIPSRACRLCAARSRCIPDRPGACARLDYRYRSQKITLPLLSQSIMSSSHTPPIDNSTLLVGRGSRRAFLRSTAVTALAGGVLAACNKASREPEAQGPSHKPPCFEDGTGRRSRASRDGPATERCRQDGCDARGWDQGIPRQDRRGRKSTARTGDGWQDKSVHLTARPIKWETAPGTIANAWAYNDQVPGPMIRVRQGDRVRLILKNELPESTSIHFHGLMVPNDQDGVPFITQPPVKPGASYTYEFTVKNAAPTCIIHITTRRSRSGWGCSAHSLSIRNAACDRASGCRPCHDPQRFWPGLHTQRQRFPCNRADRCEARAEGAHSLHE